MVAESTEAAAAFDVDELGREREDHGMTLRKAFWLGCAVATVGLTGCTTKSYIADRGRDTLDMIPFSVSTGPGLYGGARATQFLGSGLGYAETVRTGWGRRSDGSDGPLPDSLVSPDSEWQEKTWGWGLMWERDNDPKPAAGNMFFFVPFVDPNSPDAALDMSTLLDFEASIHAGLFGVRAGFSPMQFADWLAGWGNVDFLDDDLSRRDY